MPTRYSWDEVLKLQRCELKMAISRCDPARQSSKGVVSVDTAASLGNFSQFRPSVLPGCRISQASFSMIFEMFERRLGLSPYHRLDQDGPVEGQLEKNVISHNPSFRKAQYCYLSISAILAAAAGVAGYYLGVLKGHGLCDDGHSSGIAVQGENTSHQFQPMPPA